MMRHCWILNTGNEEIFAPKMLQLLACSSHVTCYFPSRKVKPKKKYEGNLSNRMEFLLAPHPAYTHSREMENRMGDKTMGTFHFILDA